MKLEICDKHEMEARAYSYLADDSFCLKCYEEKTDILWSLMAQKKPSNEEPKAEPAT